MKKVLITFSLALLGVVAIAQDGVENTEDTTIKGRSNLPKAGDIGVGFDATPFFNYAGNMFNGAINNSLNLNDNTLYFRYFLSDNSAIRTSINLSTDINTVKEYVRDDAAFFNDPTSRKQLIDQRVENMHSYSVKVGYQQYHNYKSFRGFYGADLGYGYSGTKKTYEYANQMTVINPGPSTSIWGGVPTARPLVVKDGRQHAVSLGAFIGGEYYIISHLCIGAEFGLAYGMSFDGQEYETSETMVGSQHIEEDFALNPGGMNINVNTKFPYSYGNIYLMFHF